MRLIIVRHGHPDYVRDCLTDTGRQQAAAVARRLAGEGIDRICSSTMGRALQTAACTAEMLGLPVEKCEFLRELRWGAQPSPWELVDSRIAAGTPVLDSGWQRSADYGANDRLLAEVSGKGDAADAWLAELGYVREGAYYRVSPTADTHCSIAMFTHGGATSAILSRLFGLPFPFVCQAMGADFTGVTVVQLPDVPGALAAPRFEIMSDARHISGGDIAYGQ